MAYTAGECVCVCECTAAAAAAPEQGVVGDSHQGQCSASSEAGRCATACLGQQPPRQSHFPKVARDARRPKPHGLCYRPGERDNSLTFDISVWGRSGEGSRVRAGLNLFLRM